MNRITKAELIKLCNTNGIKLTKITDQYAYIEDEDYYDGILPNIHPELCKIPIMKSWTTLTWHNGRSIDTTMGDQIVQDQKIAAIKNIRAHTGLFLKDSKDIVCDNWDTWRRMIVNK